MFVCPGPSWAVQMPSAPCLYPSICPSRPEHGLFFPALRTEGNQIWVRDGNRSLTRNPGPSQDRTLPALMHTHEQLKFPLL